jgi:two-component system sensor histidine kinase MtrB
VLVSGLLTWAGVRGRVRFSFAVGGLVLSLLLSVATWSLTSNALHDQRERTAAREALVSAELLEQALGAAPSGMTGALERAHAPGSEALLVVSSRWYSTSPMVRPASLPRQLVHVVADGTAARQRIEVQGRPVLAIGLPLTGTQNSYVELFPLDELDRTLRTLSLALLVSGALVTLLAAALGAWATQRTLRPLTDVANAAADVARGNLQRRMTDNGDPDLAPLAAAFNSQTAELERRVERDTRFASDVSHELRSPVMTIANATSVLARRRDELSAAGQEALELLQAEVMRFSSLVEDLLVVSRDGQVDALERQDVCVADLVRATADRAAGFPVTQVDGAAEHAVIAADPRRLERVVVNLVVNAQTHGAGVRLVRVECAPGHVRISIVDHGGGVPVEARERIFDRFFRSSVSRPEGGGAGLGLAIVAEHVRLHGGRVWVTDAVPCGAVFVVELPEGDACG